MSVAGFATFETSSGAKIQRLPLQAFPKFWVYAYIFSNGTQNILIDTGSGTDPSHTDLLNGLQQAGLTPQALTHIVLTHAHIDHFGGLAKLKPLTQAQITCHELDLQTIAHHESKRLQTARRLASFLADTGLAKEEQDSLLNIQRLTTSLYHSTPVDFTYRQLSLHLPGVEWIHLPGHCPGHVALRMDDVVFCGDMVVEGVTPHLVPETFSPFSGVDHYLESLEALQAWAQGARLIFNGPDDVITDLPARIMATRQNLLRRMGKALRSMTEPLTLAEICQTVYGDMGGYNLLLVIEKTGAYVEYFYQHGMIEAANPDEMEQGLPPKYRRVGAEAEALEELAARVKLEAYAHPEAGE